MRVTFMGALEVTQVAVTDLSTPHLWKMLRGDLHDH
jgi:hypothetical protein